jgi:hypothetical protein
MRYLFANLPIRSTIQTTRRPIPNLPRRRQLLTTLNRRIPSIPITHTLTNRRRRIPTSIHTTRSSRHRNRPTHTTRTTKPRTITHIHIIMTTIYLLATILLRLVKRRIGRLWMWKLSILLIMLKHRWHKWNGGWWRKNTSILNILLLLLLWVLGAIGVGSM